MGEGVVEGGVGVVDVGYSVEVGGEVRAVRAVGLVVVAFAEAGIGRVGEGGSAYVDVWGTLEMFCARRRCGVVRQARNLLGVHGYSVKMSRFW